MNSKLIEHQSAFQDYQSRYPEIVRWDMIQNIQPIPSYPIRSKEKVDDAVIHLTRTMPAIGDLTPEYVRSCLVSEIESQIGKFFDKDCEENPECGDDQVQRMITRMRRIKEESHE